MRSLAVLSVVSAGCALGAGVGYQSQKVTVHTDTPVSGTLSTSFYEFRLIDTTGIALAAFVNAGRQYNARADAMAEAQRRAEYAQPGETVRVDYSWQPMPILAGLLTDIRFRLPLGDPEILNEMGSTGRSYWAFNLRSEVRTFRPVKTLPLVSSLYLTADFEKWSAKDNSGLDLSLIDLFEVDIDLGVATSYQLGKNMTATGRVAVGALSPLLALFTPGSSYLNPSLEAEVGYRPVSTAGVGLMVSGVAYVGREFALDSPDGASAWGTRFSLNAALTFGNQRPKKWQTPETVGGTAKPEVYDPNGAISGNVCGGTNPAPECKQIASTIPEDAKILFAACVLATQSAAEKVDFSTQPQTCRTAGDGLQNIARTRTDLSDDQRRMTHIAAAVAYDFAGAGYEIATNGRWSVDQCAMVEQTHNHINAQIRGGVALPGKLAIVDGAVQECRKKYTCLLDPGNYTISCSPAQPAPVPVPVPVPVPDPAAPAPATAPTTP